MNDTSNDNKSMITLTSVGIKIPIARIVVGSHDQLQDQNRI